MEAVLLLATRSTGKLRELVPICAARGISALGLDAAGVVESRVEDELEMFDTFEGNALAKARYFHQQTRASHRSPTIPASWCRRSAVCPA